MDSFTIIKGVWDKEKTQIQRDLYNQRRTEGMKESCPSQYSFVVDRRANKFKSARRCRSCSRWASPT